MNGKNNKRVLSKSAAVAFFLNSGLSSYELLFENPRFSVLSVTVFADNFPKTITKKAFYAQTGAAAFSGQQVRGIEQGRIVRIVSTEKLGEHAINAIYRDDSGRLGERMAVSS